MSASGRATTLVSGVMPVIAVERPDVRIATVIIAAGTGSRSESIARSGFAHLAEHLLCADDGYATRIDRIAGRFAAHTRADRTVFQATVHAEDLDRLLRAEAERFAEPDLSERQVRRQVDVVRAEVGARFSRGFGTRFPAAELRSLMFDGPRDRVDRSAAIVDHDLAVAAMAAYVERHYALDRLSAVIIGGIDPQRALDGMRRAWSSVPSRSLGGRPSRGRAPTRCSGSLRVSGADRAAVALGYHVPPPDQLRSFLRFVVLAEYLTEWLRRDPEPSTGVPTASVDLLGDPLAVVGPTGLVVRGLVVDDADPAVVARRLDARVRGAGAALLASGTCELVETAKALLLARWRGSLDDITTFGASLAVRICDGGSDDLSEILGMLRETTPEDLATAAASLGAASSVALAPGRDSR